MLCFFLKKEFDVFFSSPDQARECGGCHTGSRGAKTKDRSQNAGKKFEVFLGGKGSIVWVFGSKLLNIWFLVNF